MSEENLDTSSAAADAGASTTATSDVSAPASTSSATSDGAPETDVFAGLDVNKMFGLPEEDGQPAGEPTKDVTATGQPASRQGDQTTETPTDAPSGGESETADAMAQTETQDDAGFKFNEKLNWENGNKDSQVPFREEYTALKTAYTELLANSLEGKFVNSPADFVQQMKDTSPTSYNQVGMMLVEESAQKHPDKWADFLITENPEITTADGKKVSMLDYLAEKVSGKEGMTQDRLKAELAVLLDDDEEAVNEKLAQQKAAQVTETKEETPEQKAVREWREEKAAKDAKEFITEVFSPIEASINALVSQAGLEITDADLQGKNWNGLDDDTRFKVMVNQVIPFWIDKRVSADPALKSMQGRLEEFVGAKDKTSALKLQHPAKIAAENFANEVLSLFTAARAKAKQADQIPPANDNPPPQVRSAGAGATNGNGAKGLKDPVADDEWGVSESDLVRRR